MLQERTALISDVHARPDCLAAVLEAIHAAGIQSVVCLGDLIGYGHAPAETVRTIASAARLCLLGNHDAAAVHDREYAAELSLQHREWLEQRPLLWTGNGVELVHASLYRPETFIHLKTPNQVEEHFSNQRERIAFFGHTHIPILYHRSLDGRMRRAHGEGSFLLDQPGFYAAGVGSVAFSRDDDKRPCWVEYNPAECAISFHRVG